MSSEPVRRLLLLQGRARQSMVAQRYGKIVNIASVSAMKGGGSFGNVLYGTTKAGVVALTKGLGRELAPFGINVNAIAPGVVETNMTDFAADSRAPQSRARAPYRLAASRPPTISRTSLHCWRPIVLAYVTGETIVVDGGYLTR